MGGHCTEGATGAERRACSIWLPEKGNRCTFMRACRPACARPTLPSCRAHIAALWAWNVYSRVQQRREDQDTLQAMAARPLAITEHAACRMDCRCDAAVLHASCRRPAGLLCGRDRCRLPGRLTAGRHRAAWFLPSQRLLLVIMHHATPRAPHSFCVPPLQLHQAGRNRGDASLRAHQRAQEPATAQAM